MDYLELDQAGQLQAIGAKLSQARQAKGISLEEIATKTFIRQQLLSAIEAGRLDLLPEPVFIQGFIRRFATEVGLDGAALAQEFSVAPPIAPVILEEVPPEPPSVPLQWLTQVKWSVWLPLLGTGVALVVLVGIAMMNRPKSEDPSPKAVKSGLPSNLSQPLDASKAGAKSEVAPSPSLGESGAPSSSPIANFNGSLATNSETANKEPVEVKLNLIDESWVSIEADGKLEYEGTLAKGMQKTWKAKQQIVVNTGNAGGVSASFNGSTLKPLGTKGSVVSVSYPPEKTQL